MFKGIEIHSVSSHQKQRSMTAELALRLRVEVRRPRGPAIVPVMRRITCDRNYTRIGTWALFGVALALSVFNERCMAAAVSDICPLDLAVFNRPQ